MVAHWLRSIYRRFLSEDALLCGGDKYLLHRSYANSVSPPHSGKTGVHSESPLQTSVTIDDVIYVVDGGKVKETHYDAEAGLTKLTEQWVTRAAAKQRRGRAGRTQPGICYKLYTRAQDKRMAPFPIPEIKRVPLESIALTQR